MGRGFWHDIILNLIEERGRAQGAPIVEFPEREIFVEGDDFKVGLKWYELLFSVSGFFLSLPPNAYGVVIHPDGRAENMQGGMYRQAPPGLYQIRYVDKQERSGVSAPASEITTDGEKLTLRIIVRYRVRNPELALGIARPVDTMMEHLEADVAQYIRTHDHSQIADSADNQNSRLFAFFSERHKRRAPLGEALEILGVELKEFAGDKEYVELRRKGRMDERQAQFIRQQEEHQQEINRLKAEHKAENERRAAELKEELDRRAVEQRTQIETLEARHQREKEEILHQMYLKQIELDDRRQRWQRQYEKFAKAFDAISQAVSTGYPVNPNAFNTLVELINSIKDEIRKEDFTPGVKAASAAGGGDSKVEKLTNTLLDLLKRKK